MLFTNVTQFVVLGLVLVVGLVLGLLIAPRAPSGAAAMRRSATRMPRIAPTPTPMARA